MAHRKTYLEKLAEVLVLNATGERHLAMFSAYLDESGKGNERTSFLAVGGLVSSALQWGRLSTEWKAHLLRVPGMPLDANGDPVPFHMTDFETGNWPVKSYRWRSEKAKYKFLDGLVDIMTRRIKLRVFTVVWLSHYHELFPRDPKKKGPWVLSALGCASLISKWGEKNLTDPIPFIFERGGEGWGLAFSNYQEFEKTGKIGKTKIGKWSFDDKNVAALQAADIWAWQLRMFFKIQIQRGEMQITEAMSKIIRRIPDGYGYILEGSSLTTLVEDFRNKTSMTKSFHFNSRSLPTITFTDAKK